MRTNIHMHTCSVLSNTAQGYDLQYQSPSINKENGF